MEEKPAYDLAHDILADKRLPRQEAIDEFTRKTKCHLCGGWGFHENSCPHWPRGDNSHNAEQAVDEKLMRFVAILRAADFDYFGDGELSHAGINKTIDDALMELK